MVVRVLIDKVLYFNLLEIMQKIEAAFIFQAVNGTYVFHYRFWISSADAELYAADSAGSIGFGFLFTWKWPMLPFLV